MRRLTSIGIVLALGLTLGVSAWQLSSRAEVREAKIPRYGLHMEKMSADCRRSFEEMSGGHQEFQMDIPSYERFIRRLNECGGKLEAEK